uniref:Uncharacterized protein n=1 Tax=Tanacetum cinerariifolium TaxID=118510 RepID=A0A6L2MDN9_TANCI|nr:hypothetical protein [Tanacetum cinerariifolium]
MTGNRRLFTSYKAYDDGHAVFGMNLKGKVTSGGNISHDSIPITKVEHVRGRAFNLINVDDRINELIVQDLNGSSSLQVNVLDECYTEGVKEARGHPIEQVIGELNDRTLSARRDLMAKFKCSKDQVSWTGGQGKWSRDQGLIACGGKKARSDLALQFYNACTAKDDLRKAYEKCNDIPQERRALIDTFLKNGFNGEEYCD